MFKGQKIYTDNTRSRHLFLRNDWNKKVTSPTDVSVQKNNSVMCEQISFLSFKGFVEHQASEKSSPSSSLLSSHIKSMAPH